MSPTNRSERFYKHKHGEIEKLAYDNYARWKGSVKFPAIVVEACNTANSLEEQPLNEDSEEFNIYLKRPTKVFTIVYNSCSENIKQSIREIDDSVTIWDLLKNQYDSSSSSIGRLALRQKFDQTRPNPNDSINIFFDILLFLEWITRYSRCRNCK